MYANIGQLCLFCTYQCELFNHKLEFYQLNLNDSLVIFILVYILLNSINRLSVALNLYYLLLLYLFNKLRIANVNQSWYTIGIREVHQKEVF
jgi:hypothetical protein